MKINTLASYPLKKHLLSINAEARVYRGEYLGFDVVVKERTPKKYRNPLLDHEIRKSRTFTEAKTMYQARQGNIGVPKIFLIHPTELYIVMEYVEGEPLKKFIEKSNDQNVFYKIGQQVAKLHNLNIVHGDLTTSNIIVDNGDNGEVTLIDFGLAQFTTAVEDKAVDMNVFYRTLESTHPSIWETAWNEFVRGYREVASEHRRILKRMEKIDERVRYKKH